MALKGLHKKLLIGSVTIAAAVLLYKTLVGRLKHSLRFVIGKTWDDQPLHHEKAEVTFSRAPSDMVEMRVRAPFYIDPPAPSGAAGTAFSGLWDYEVVEAFFLSESGKYLEIELCPHGQHLLLLLNGRRNMIRDQLPIQYNATISGTHWEGVALIPLHYFPPAVSKFNAYAIHGSNSNRQYEAYNAVIGDQPDFHRLEYFVPIDFTKIAPENSNPSLYTSTFWQQA